MSRPLARPGPITPQEFLAYEERSATKHEYVGGDVYALAGASPRHNLIALNVASALRDAARGGVCRVYVSDVKLRTPDGRFYYPDVLVVRAPGHEAQMVQIAPCLLVEVTSQATERTDRHEKLVAYQRIPELRAYLIVDPERRRVTRHWRDASGEWRRDDPAEDPVAVPCPETVLDLERIYEGTAVAD